MKKKTKRTSKNAAPAAEVARFVALVATLKKQAAFKHVVAAYEKARAVGGSAFGRNALRVDGKIFAMMSHGRLVLKLPASRVAALIASGDGAPFDANKGKPMKEWVALRDDSTLSWLELARDAHAFVSQSSTGST